MAVNVKILPVLLAWLGAAGCQDHLLVNSPAPRLLSVDSVEIVQLESFPVQVTARVTGTVPDPCTAIDDLRQSREGATIDVVITVVRRGESCIQVVTRVTHDVRLSGGFPPGDYLVRVNGLATPFSVR